MKLIKKQLEVKSTEELKSLFYTLRGLNEDGSAIAFSILCDVLEDRIGDELWDM